MNVGQLISYIKAHRIPDDAPVMITGASDHSRAEADSLEDTVIKEGLQYTEDFGEDVTDFGKRIKALVIR